MQQIRLAHVEVGPEEERAVLDVLRSGRLAQGPQVAALEERVAAIAGTEYAVAVSSGTTALIAALQALEIGPGQEVITTPLTFAASVNAVLAVGATARIVDVTGDGTIDPAAVGAARSEATAAVMPVHLYGYPADMAGLAAAVPDVPIVEDAAQAIGAAVDGRPVGSFGLGCFSLYATKNVMAGEGGVITSSDADLTDRLRLLRNQGSRERYRYETIGFNYRLTELQAAVANPQLDRLDDITAARRANAAAFTAGLADLPGLLLPAPVAGRRHVYHLYTVRITPDAPISRSTLAASLAADGIETGVVYPDLVHDAAPYRDHAGVAADPTPTAAQLTGQVLSLPVHPGLGPEDPDRIVAAVRRAYGR